MEHLNLAYIRALLIYCIFISFGTDTSRTSLKNKTLLRKVHILFDLDKIATSTPNTLNYTTVMSWDIIYRDAKGQHISKGSPSMFTTVHHLKLFCCQYLLAKHLASMAALRWCP